jgi:hypothetical protein
MTQALITDPFPSTAEVARKLGLPESRVRRIAALMGLSATGANGRNADEAPRKASRRVDAKSAPRTRTH